MWQDPMWIGKGQRHAETRAVCSAQGTSISAPWEGVRLSWLLWHMVANSNIMKCPNPTPTPSHTVCVCPPKASPARASRLAPTAMAGQHRDLSRPPAQ